MSLIQLSISTFAAFIACFIGCTKFDSRTDNIITHLAYLNIFIISLVLFFIYCYPCKILIHIYMYIFQFPILEILQRGFYNYIQYITYFVISFTISFILLSFTNSFKHKSVLFLFISLSLLLFPLAIGDNNKVGGASHNKPDINIFLLALKASYPSRVNYSSSFFFSRHLNKSDINKRFSSVLLKELIFKAIPSLPTDLAPLIISYLWPRLKLDITEDDIHQCFMFDLWLDIDPSSVSKLQRENKLHIDKCNIDITPLLHLGNADQLPLIQIPVIYYNKYPSKYIVDDTICPHVQKRVSQNLISLQHLGDWLYYPTFSPSSSSFLSSSSWRLSILKATHQVFNSFMKENSKLVSVTSKYKIGYKNWGSFFMPDLHNHSPLDYEIRLHHSYDQSKRYNSEDFASNGIPLLLTFQISIHINGNNNKIKSSYKCVDMKPRVPFRSCINCELKLSKQYEKIKNKKMKHKLRNQLLQIRYQHSQYRKNQQTYQLTHLPELSFTNNWDLNYWSLNHRGLNYQI